jgi:hypothetical protein
MPANDGSPEGSDPARGDSTGLLRDEARQVLDAQLRTLRDTDRKAMATARVDALILGLLLSAGSLADAPRTAINPWLVGGTSFVLGSLAVAVLTYSVDRPSYGVNPTFIETTLKNREQREAVESDLLAGYAEWIRSNGDEISSNSTYLLVSQGLLVVGLSAVATGIYEAL